MSPRVWRASVAHAAARTRSVWCAGTHGLECVPAVGGGLARWPWLLGVLAASALLVAGAALR